MSKTTVTIIIVFSSFVANAYPNIFVKFSTRDCVNCNNYLSNLTLAYPKQLITIIADSATVQDSARIRAKYKLYRTPTTFTTVDTVFNIVADNAESYVAICNLNKAPVIFKLKNFDSFYASVDTCKFTVGAQPLNVDDYTSFCWQQSKTLSRKVEENIKLEIYTEEYGSTATRIECDTAQLRKAYKMFYGENYVPTFNRIISVMQSIPGLDSKIYPITYTNNRPCYLAAMNLLVYSEEIQDSTNELQYYLLTQDAQKNWSQIIPLKDDTLLRCGLQLNINFMYRSGDSLICATMKTTDTSKAPTALAVFRISNNSLDLQALLPYKTPKYFTPSNISLFDEWANSDGKCAAFCVGDSLYDFETKRTVQLPFTSARELVPQLPFIAADKTAWSIRTKDYLPYLISIRKAGKNYECVYRYRSFRANDKSKDVTYIKFDAAGNILARFENYRTTDLDPLGFIRGSKKIAYVHKGGCIRYLNY
jgi:hypothetical protein